MDNQRQPPTDTAQTWINWEQIADLNPADRMALIKKLSPIALAYLGDAVYELFVRSKFLMPPKRMASYHSQVVTQVRAESQALHLAALIPELNDAEKEILRRGRNACGGKPRRLSRHIYQQATALETLIGYLYLSDPPRLQELFAKLSFAEVASSE